VPIMGGRITELSIEEGDDVKEGDLVARIDCAELELQLKQADAAVKGANANLKLLEKGARKEDIRAMRQTMKQARISLAKIEKDKKTSESLLKSGAVPKNQVDDLESAHGMASAQLGAAQQQYSKLLKGAQPEEIEAALSMVEQAEAMVDVVRQKLTNCELYAPSSGTIMYKLAEQGEVAAPGIPVGVVADLSRVEVKGYVAEKDLGFVKIGGRAQVVIDSMPSKPIKAKITHVASEAEFTPKNIQTREERIKTMYEIKVSVDNTEGMLKSGMPADIVIKK
ncbi:MAG: efflux RND transporter periplasmic adaptor subunit, partial [Pseudomonadota bacterium]